jgi:hypothetical protein
LEHSILYPAVKEHLKSYPEIYPRLKKFEETFDELNEKLLQNKEVLQKYFNPELEGPFKFIFQVQQQS